MVGSGGATAAVGELYDGFFVSASVGGESVTLLRSKALHGWASCFVVGDGVSQLEVFCACSDSAVDGEVEGYFGRVVGRGAFGGFEGEGWVTGVQGCGCGNASTPQFNANAWFCFG